MAESQKHDLLRSWRPTSVRKPAKVMGIASKATSVRRLVWKANGTLRLSPRIPWQSLVKF
jgi:hypothetical protein